ncbi:MAG: hypothetical protein R3240_08200, partial [Gammaproteobacteria bacterium]|nr:hypothetical protein [Gammaproteobacteria bacterium]
LIEMGYADAMSYLASKSETGMTLSENTTAQQTPVTGIRFTEKLEGEMAFEFPDDYGLNSGQVEFILYLSCHVQDLDEFIHSQHSARLTGSLFIKDLQREFYFYDGVYSFETESLEYGSKQIYYQASINWDGKLLKFSGTKTLRDDLGPDMWQDLTTMKISLERQELTGQESFIEGVGKMKIADMAKLLASVHATGTDSKEAAFNAHARFSRFMLGETVEVYT